MAARDDFARLPEALRTQLGPLALTPERRLACKRGDTRPGGAAAGAATRRPAVLTGRKATLIRGNLVLRGFHLQIPPAGDLDPMSGDWGTDA